MNQTKRLVDATRATLARFEDRPFDWTKSATCVHMMRYHAAQLGHDLPIVPRFRSPLGAKQALKAAGFDSLPALLDTYFERVPPSFLRVGDFLVMPGDAVFDALIIKIAGHKFLGWHEGAEGCTIMEVDIDKAVGAWRG